MKTARKNCGLKNTESRYITYKHKFSIMGVIIVCIKSISKQKTGTNEINFKSTLFSIYFNWEIRIVHTDGNDPIKSEKLYK